MYQFLDPLSTMISICSMNQCRSIRYYVQYLQEVRQFDVGFIQYRFILVHGASTDLVLSKSLLVHGASTDLVLNIYWYMEQVLIEYLIYIGTWSK